MSKPIIRLDSVRFGWRRQAAPLLQVARFDVAPGERLFLYGASGSGKSTLLSLVAGVLQAQAGSIEVLGQSLTTMGDAGRDRFRADHFGIIFQQFNLIPYLSVIENVILPCHFSASRRQKALARGDNLADEAMRLLEHLEMADDDDNDGADRSAGDQDDSAPDSEPVNEAIAADEGPAAEKL